MSELTEKIADFFKVLSEQTRLEILDLLRNGERSSKEIEKTLDKSQSTISQHLKTLYDADLIYFDKKGNKNYYFIKFDYIYKILNFIQSFVITLHKEKTRRLTEMDIKDTLF